MMLQPQTGPYTGRGGGVYGKIHCISAQNMIDDTMLKFELGQHILCSLVNIMSLAPPCKNAADY